MITIGDSPPFYYLPPHSILVRIYQFTVQKSFHYSPSFPISLLCGFSFNSTGCNPYCPYLFQYSNCHRFGQWEPCKAGLCLFDVCIVWFCFLSTFSLSACFKLILYFYYLSPGVSHFSKDPWFWLLLVVREIFKIKMIGWIR